MKRRLLFALCLLVCIAAICGSCLWAEAADTTVIRYEVDAYYEFVIPDEVSTEGTIPDVYVQANPVLPEGTRITLSVKAGAGNTTVIRSDSGSAPYSILCGGNVLSQGQIFLTQPAGATAQAATTLTYRVDAELQTKAVYTDTLTFCAAIAADPN